MKTDILFCDKNVLHTHNSHQKPWSMHYKTLCKDSWKLKKRFQHPLSTLVTLIFASLKFHSPKQKHIQIPLKQLLRESIKLIVLAFHLADLGMISDIYHSSEHCQEWALSKEPKSSAWYPPKLPKIKKQKELKQE